jgi:hypothetical protein
MKKLMTCIALLALAAVTLCAGGCGNVYLRGEALTAAETSAMDAFQAAQRASAEPPTPAWQRAYLEENFKQWRFFVRAARKDEAWGPTLEAEASGGGE